MRSDPRNPNSRKIIHPLENLPIRDVWPNQQTQSANKSSLLVVRESLGLLVLVRSKARELCGCMRERARGCSKFFLLYCTILPCWICFVIYIPACACSNGLSDSLVSNNTLDYIVHSASACIWLLHNCCTFFASRFCLG